MYGTLINLWINRLLSFMRVTCFQIVHEERKSLWKLQDRNICYDMGSIFSNCFQYLKIFNSLGIITEKERCSDILLEAFYITELRPATQKHLRSFFEIPFIHSVILYKNNTKEIKYLRMIFLECKTVLIYSFLYISNKHMGNLPTYQRDSSVNIIYRVFF